MIDQRLHALAPRASGSRGTPVPDAAAPAPAAPLLPAPVLPALDAAPTNAAAPADAAAPAPASVHPASPWLFRVLLAAVVAAALMTTVLATMHLRARAVDSSRRAALAAGQAAAPDLFSYDHRRLEEDFAEARAHLTGEIAQEYAATTASRVRAAARATQATVDAAVSTAAVVSAAPEDAVLLLVVDQRTQRTQSAGAAQPALRQNLVRLTLRKVDGTWKVSGIATL